MNPTAASIQVASVHPAANARSASKAADGKDAASLVDFSAILAEQLTPLRASASDVAQEPEALEGKAQPRRQDRQDAAETAEVAVASLPSAPLPEGLGRAPDPLAGRESRPASGQAGKAITTALEGGQRPAPSVGLPADLAPPVRQEAADVAAELAPLPERPLPADKDAVQAPAGSAAPAAMPGMPAAVHASSASVDRAGGTGAAIALHGSTFGEEVANRVTWLATHGRQEAEIRIDPPHLGPVEMRLSISGDQATLSLVSPHAAVRDALQNSVPRLQEMMQAAGVNLGQVDVGSQSAGQQQADSRHGGQDRAPAANGDEARMAATPALSRPGQRRAGVGLVDVFA